MLLQFAPLLVIQMGNFFSLAQSYNFRTNSYVRKLLKNINFPHCVNKLFEGYFQNQVNAVGDCGQQDGDSLA